MLKLEFRSLCPFLACLTLFTCTLAGQSALVDFDHYPNGVPVNRPAVFTDQWASVGVVFSDGGGGGPGPSGNSCSLSAPNHAAADGLIVATFVDPCSGAPSATDSVTVYQDLCWAAGEGIDVFAFDSAGTQIGHQFAAGGGTWVSFNFKTPIIARLDIYHIGQGIDDFTFNTPAEIFETCPADVAGSNSAVDVDDLLVVINNWGVCGLGICEGDINCDLTVDVDDLLAVINGWGACE